MSPANERPFVGSYRVLCPWRAKIPSSQCTPGRGTISPRVIQKIPAPLCGRSWARALLPPRSTGYSSASMKVTHFKTSEFELYSLFAKNLGHSVPLPPSLWPKRCSCANLEPILSTRSLPPPPPTKASLCPSAAQQLFSPPNSLTSTHLSPATLSPSNMEILLPVLRLISWVSQVL